MFRLCIFLVFAQVALAQAGADRGEVSGRVIDPQSRLVPRAKVTLTDPSRGVSRSTLTDDQGEFLFALTPPSAYRIQVEAEGFPPKIVEPVEVLVGQSVPVVAQLALPRRADTITVSEAPPVIEEQRVHQATMIESERIRNLPINRRNYLDFALLAPGVVETSTLVDDSDFRVASAPSSNLGFSGNNGRGNFVTVDGISLNGWTSNVRPSIPQAAVQEFQINRNGYSAEYGGASGGVVNIVSRSGSNTFHGEIFGLLRQRELQARNYFDPARSAYTRQQSGVALDGPVRKDRTFFAASYERLDRHESVFVSNLQDPGILTRLKPSQIRLLDIFAAASDPTLAGLSPVLRRLLTPATSTATVRLFESNSGVFPFSADSNQASVRLDHHAGPTHHLQFRASITRDYQANTRFGALAGYSHGNSVRWRDQMGSVADTWFASPRLSLVTRAAFALTRNTVRTNDPIGPEIRINGFGIFGRDSQFPFEINERYWQFQQTLFYTAGRHSIKAGMDLAPIRTNSFVETYFGGQFFFGEAIPVGAVIDIVAGAPGFSAGLATRLPSQLAQDLLDPINSLQSYALGLPLAYLQGIGNTSFLGWRSNYSGFAEDSWRPRPGLTINFGLRLQYETLPYMPNNRTLAPRFGFAWSPGKSRDWVVRGSYGLFFPWTIISIPFVPFQLTRPDVNLAFIPITGAAGVVNPLTSQPLTSVDIYQYLGARGILGSRPIIAADLAALGLSTTQRYPVTGAVQSDYQNPYSQQASLEVERAFGDIAVSASLLGQRTAHLWRNRDINVQQVGTQPGGFPLLGRVNPLIANYYLLETSGNAFYHALTLQVSRRLRNHWGFQAHYTHSRSTDDMTDFTIEYMAANPLNVRDDRGLSPFHQKHRLVAAAILESPLKGFRGGWMLSPILRANSFRPFNLLTGADNLGDGQTTTHRPLGLGRNTGMGPNAFSIDARLSRRFTFRKESPVAMHVTMEAFNILNRTNFLTVNNILGNVPLSSLPSPARGVRGLPTDPLSFTSAANPRQFQLGLKVSF